MSTGDSASDLPEEAPWKKPVFSNRLRAAFTLQDCDSIQWKIWVPLEPVPLRIQNWAGNVVYPKNECDWLLSLIYDGQNLRLIESSRSIGQAAAGAKESHSMEDASSPSFQIREVWTHPIYFAVWNFILAKYRPSMQQKNLDNISPGYINS